MTLTCHAFIYFVFTLQEAAGLDSITTGRLDHRDLKNLIWK